VPWSTHPAATAAAGTHALRGQDHLQHLVRVFEEVLKFVPRRAQHLLRKLRRHLDPRHRGIFRHVANFIHPDAGVSRQRGFQLFGERRRLGVSAGEGAHKSRELRLRECGRKMDARDSRGSQKVREASFAGSRSQWHAVQQNLCARRSKKHTTAAAVIQRAAQFFPRRFKLLHGLRVPKLVQTREFQQNIQAADKRPRPASLFLNHSCRGWTLPLLTLSLQ